MVSKVVNSVATMLTTLSEFGQVTFKVMHLEIQGLKAEKGVRNQSKLKSDVKLLKRQRHERNELTKCPILNAKQFQKISTNARTI